MIKWPVNNEEELSMEHISDDVKKKLLESHEKKIKKLCLIIKELSDARNDNIQGIELLLKNSNKTSAYINVIIDNEIRQLLKDNGLVK